MMKKVIVILGIVLLAVGIGVYYLWENMDEIAERAIERNGSRALGSEVEVGSVEILPQKGRATIRNLTVANPPGYSANPIFRFDEISAEVDLKNLIVSRIFSDRPAVRVEIIGTDNNLLALRRILTTASSQQPTDSSTDEAGKSEKDMDQSAAIKEQHPEDDLQIQIDLIEISNLQASVFKDTETEPLTASLDKLQITNLKGTRPELARQITSQLVGMVVGEVLEATLRNKLENRYGDELKKAGEKLKNLLK